MGGSEAGPSVLPDDVTTGSRFRAVGAVGCVLLLITIAALVGADLNRRGVEILLPTPPLIAYWHPHVGWGTPLVVICVALGVLLQRRAVALPWWRLLVAGWMLSLSWMMSLIMVDGLRQGWIEVLLNPNEYLHDLSRIASPTEFLRSYTSFVAFGPVVGGDQVWTTHVAGHPPLTTLVFWWLERVGLGGGLWAGAACILVGSTASVAIPITVAQLGAPTAARRLVPYVALFPGAVWMGVSADGLFAGVACSGLALSCRGAMRRQPVWSLVGGVLLGSAVFLSYGMVLFGVVVLVALVITALHRRSSVLIGWLVTLAGALAVAAVHLALGFNWFAGLAALHTRYYQGIASTRPFSYFVWANFAAWAISCSPLIAVALDRAFGVLRHGGRRTQDRVVAVIAVSGLTCAVLADLSALSKAETERIWLTFGLIASTGFALLRGRSATICLIAAAGCAITVNHLFDTGW